MYQYKVLPFGLGLSPWTFTRLVRDLLQKCRSQNTRLNTYIDDWLVLAANTTMGHNQSSQLKALATKLGFVINEEKSDLTPSRTFSYLGMTLDTHSQTVHPMVARLELLSSLLDSLLFLPQAQVRRLYKALGMMESLATLLPLGRVHKRPLQRELSRRFDQSSGQWNMKIPTFPWLHQAVSQWLNRDLINQQVPNSLPPQHPHPLPPTPILDHLHGRLGEGVGGPHGQPHSGGHVELPRHSTPHQQPGAGSCLQRPHRMPTQSTTGSSHDKVRQQDSGSSNKQPRGHKGPIPVQESRTNPPLSTNQGMVITGQTHSRKRKSPGRPAKQTGQDNPDRVDHLTPNPAQDLGELGQTHDGPLHNQVLEEAPPIRVPSTRSRSVLHRRHGHRLVQPARLHVPPWSMLNAVIKKARSEGPNLILVASFCPAKAWFPILNNLSHEPPIDLKLKNKDLLQPRSGISHGSAETLNLHAWRLCGSSCAERGCLKGQ